MEYAKQEQGRERDWTIDDLSELRRFSGSPDQFWPTFLENTARLVGAVLGLLLVKMKEGESWKAFAVWPGKSPEPPFASRRLHAGAGGQGFCPCAGSRPSHSEHAPCGRSAHRRVGASQGDGR